MAPILLGVIMHAEIIYGKNMWGRAPTQGSRQRNWVMLSSGNVWPQWLGQSWVELLRDIVLPIRVLLRFFEQVGHEDMFASSGNKQFFTK